MKNEKTVYKNRWVYLRLRLYTLYSLKKCYVSSEMKRRGVGLRQDCFHTELPFMLSFSSMYLTSCYSQWRPYSIHSISACTLMPTGIGDILGLSTTSSCWHGRVQSRKGPVWYLPCHTNILALQMVHIACLLSIPWKWRTSPLLMHTMETLHLGVNLQLGTAFHLWSWVKLVFHSSVSDYLLVILVFLYKYL